MYCIGEQRYPVPFIAKCSQPTPWKEPEPEAHDQGDDEQSMIFVPYVAGLSEDIKSVCMQTIWHQDSIQIGTNIADYLTRVKDELPPLLKSCVVYRIP